MTAFGVYVLWSFMGWLLLGLGIHNRRSWKLRNECERVRVVGTIVELIETHTSAKYYNNVVWYPVIRYEAEGTEYRFKDEYVIDPQQHPVGSTLEVLYDPTFPKHVHVDAGGAREAGAALSIRIGLIWVVVATLGVLVLNSLSSGYGLDIFGALGLDWDLIRVRLGMY